MKSYFDRVKNKISGAHEKMKDYWFRRFNRSTRTKTSEGTQEIKRIITSAHGDQWRKGSGKK